MPLTAVATSPLRPLLLAAIAAMVGAIAMACGGGEDGALQSPTVESPSPAVMTVVTTLPVFADFVREAGGDRVDVTAILPDGLVPGLIDLPPEDVERIGRADLILYNGLELEGAVLDLLFEHRRRGSQIVDYSKDVASPTVEGMTAYQARDNPYLWLDPVLALTYVDTSWDSLAIGDRAAAGTYETNAERYKEQLRALHEEIQETLGSIPSDSRRLVTFNDTFFHLANRYGLEPVRLPEPVSTAVPNPNRVKEWAQLLREQGVPAVFTQPGSASELLNQAALRAGVQVCTLYADSLDDEVTTYIEMMRFNASELSRCLGGR